MRRKYKISKGQTGKDDDKEGVDEGGNGACGRGRQTKDDSRSFQQHRDNRSSSSILTSTRQQEGRLGRGTLAVARQTKGLRKHTLCSFFKESFATRCKNDAFCVSFTSCKLLAHSSGDRTSESIIFFTSSS